MYLHLINFLFLDRSPSPRFCPNPNTNLLSQRFLPSLTSQIIVCKAQSLMIHRLLSLTIFTIFQKDLSVSLTVMVTELRGWSGGFIKMTERSKLQMPGLSRGREEWEDEEVKKQDGKVDGMLKEY